jgi:uracil-DNA glycosylase
MSTEQEKYFFWQQFLTVANQITDLYQDSAIRKNKHYIHITTGVGGLYYSTVCNLGDSWVEICIQRKDDSEEIYTDISRHQQVIERDFGEPLVWVNEPEKKRCKIMTRRASRGHADADIDGLARILTERMVDFYNATHRFLPAQLHPKAVMKKQVLPHETILKRKALNELMPQPEQGNTNSIGTIAAVEDLFKKSMNCRSCFENGISVTANIDIAQPRLIGKNYFSATPRIMVIALNPGAGNSAEKRKANKAFSQYLYSYRDGTKTLAELFSFQAEYMQQWGTPPGRYLRFYCDGIGLTLNDIAMANIAWCADANNTYPPPMLNDCFRRHTEPLIRLLEPEIIILSGSSTHSFAGKINQALPSCSVITTLHYAHRKGKNVEEQEFQIVRDQIRHIMRR